MVLTTKIINTERRECIAHETEIIKSTERGKVRLSKRGW